MSADFDDLVTARLRRAVTETEVMLAGARAGDWALVTKRRELRDACLRDALASTTGQPLGTRNIERIEDIAALNRDILEQAAPERQACRDRLARARVAVRGVKAYRAAG